jgi:CheY-like chemotaxis protein
MTGWEFLDARRTNQRAVHVPVVAISGAEESISGAPRARFDAVLPKPLSIDTLINEVTRLSRAVEERSRERRH